MRLFIYQRVWRMMPSPAVGWQQLGLWSFWCNTSHPDAGPAVSSLLGLGCLGHWFFWAGALSWLGWNVSCNWVWPRQLPRGESGTTCLYASSCFGLDHLQRRHLVCSERKQRRCVGLKILRLSLVYLAANLRRSITHKTPLSETCCLTFTNVTS